MEHSVERFVVIPRKGGGPPSQVLCRTEHLQVFREADCGPVVEEYDWDEDLQDFHCTDRRRCGPVAYERMKRDWEAQFKGGGANVKTEEEGGTDG